MIKLSNEVIRNRTLQIKEYFNKSGNYFSRLYFYSVEGLNIPHSELTDRVVAYVDIPAPVCTIDGNKVIINLSNTVGVGVSAGIAVWAKLFNSNNEFCMDLDVGKRDSKRAIELDSILIRPNDNIFLVTSCIVDG